MSEGENEKGTLRCEKVLYFGASSLFGEWTFILEHLFILSRLAVDVNLAPILVMLV